MSGEAIGKTDEKGKGGKGKAGLIGLMLGPLAGGAVALGVSYFDPFGDGPTEEPRTPAQHAGKGDPDSRSHGEGTHEASPTAVVPIDPMVVSLASSDARRRAPRLRIGIAIETHGGGDAAIKAEMPRLRDGFTTAVRALGQEAVMSADGLEALRAALTDSATSILGDDAVAGVLITEFVTT